MPHEVSESSRTRHTRRAMQDALVELLSESAPDSITVKHLCTQAGINRSTFYAHYDNLNDLLHEIEEDTLAWARGAISSTLEQTDQLGIERVLTKICDYIADNRNHLHILLSPKADVGFQQDLLRLIYGRVEASQPPQPRDADPTETQMRLHFIVSGSIGLLQYWLATDLAAPARTVAHTIHEMSELQLGLPAANQRHAAGG